MPGKYHPIPLNFQGYPVNNVQRSPYDGRDYPALAASEPPAKLPSFFEVPSLPILNQGGKGACACFGLLRILVRAWLNAGVVVDLSEDYLYARAREIHQWLCQDTGSVPRDICELLVKEGCPTEADREYNDRDLCTGTTPEQRAAGAPYKADEYRLCRNLDDVKQVLYQHRNGVTICLDLYDSFWQTDYTGVMPKPSGTYRGGHLMTVVGWHDANRWLKVENWWTRHFGADGYLYVPYDIFNLPGEQGGAWTGDLWTLIVHPRETPQPEPEDPPVPETSPFGQAKRQSMAIARYWAQQYTESYPKERDRTVQLQYHYAAIVLDWLAGLIDENVKEATAVAAPRFPLPFAMPPDNEAEELAALIAKARAQQREFKGY